MLEGIRAKYRARADEQRSLAEVAQAKAEQERQRVEQERQQAAEAQAKAEALASWKKAGGSPTDFETAWPELRRSMIAAKVVEQERQRQLAAAQLSRSVF